MKSTVLGIIVAIFLVSCGHEKEKAQLQMAKLRAEIERDQLLLEKKNNILRHLNEYLPITPHLEIAGLGGFDPGTVFIENKTGYDVQKVIVAIEFIKANGSYFNTQYLQFNNLQNGDSQSKPTQSELRGVKYRYYVSAIIGPELTNGQEITSR